MLAGSMMKPVLFFDGHCYLCNESVRLLLKLDRHRRLRYAPLQGETARQLREDLAGILNSAAAGRFSESPDSIVFFDGNRLLTAWKALMGIAALLWPRWKWLAGVMALPPISWAGEACYRIIAAVRYRIFGETRYCAVVNRTDLELFLP
jgi:predicted DCC family thiol-disulfide oxidoreductase YuxK